jgi:hypothetical protein
MLAESALRSALDKVTPIKLAGKFWRVVTTSSLLGLVRGEKWATGGHADLSKFALRRRSAVALADVTRRWKDQTRCI